MVTAIVDRQPRIRRSALFVDFDNVFSGLADIDRRTAEAFGTDPASWVATLTGGTDDEGPFQRRFLTRVCYLNPVMHARYRPFFTRSGFRVVDCPPLTTRQKNSADIHMVLDILDALAHPAHYDEFVVASADADFTPVMQRLRAHDRLTAIVTAGPAAAAYLSVCDAVILPDELGGAVRSPVEATARPQGSGARSLRSPARAGSRTAPAPDTVASSEPDLALGAVKVAILEAVRASTGPLVMASAAQAALAVDPTLSDQGWAGTGKFGSFVTQHVPELKCAPHLPGYLFDPARHSAADVPAAPQQPTRPPLPPILAQVSRVTNAPSLSSDQYAVLFEELAGEVDANGFDHRTTKNVRDRAHIREQPIGRSSVQFVVQGLAYAGRRPQPGVSAGELAEAWLGCIREMSANAQMQLSDADVDELSQWITGGLLSG